MEDNTETENVEIPERNNDMNAIDSVIYQPEVWDLYREDELRDPDQRPPMAVYQPWDKAFDDSDFHIQNPADDSEIDVYSGHAGIANVWMEEDEVTIFYEFDDSITMGRYPVIDDELISGTELHARKALTEGEPGLAIRTSAENVERVVREISELDESLLEEGNTHDALLLGLRDSRELDSPLEGKDDKEFERHREWYEKKDREEAW